MAGDWIKMRDNLWNDPRVLRICDLTGSQEAVVIGALYWLWTAADQHTEDGNLLHLSAATINRKTGLKGFCEALCEVDWLAVQGQGVQIVRFTEHNGASAKKRSLTAKRVGTHRNRNADSVSASNADSVTEALQLSYSSVSGALAREEKRREEQKQRPPTPNRIVPLLDYSFSTFWQNYPKKQAKALAFKAWKKLNPDEALQTAILAAVQQKSQSENWLTNGGKFVPHAATWLNGRRWEDETSPATADIFSRAI